MFGDDLFRSELRCFVKGYIIIEPWSANHPRLLILRISECARYHIAHAVHHAHAHRDIVIADIKLDSFIRNEFRLGRHDRPPCSALGQFVYNAFACIFVSDLRQNHKIHKSLNKGRFARAHGADNTDIDVTSGTLFNIPVNTCIRHTNLRSSLSYL